jgi:hypothetical protein
MRRICVAVVAIGALMAPAAAGADPSPRACLGQTLKTEAGTADFGQGTAAETQTVHPFGRTEVRVLAQCG